jgi:hypothetical protein
MCQLLLDDHRQFAGCSVRRRASNGTSSTMPNIIDEIEATCSNWVFF